MNDALKMVHRLALLLLVLTFVLVALGGFVHNSGSSLACPDWPLCFGQVFPKMEGNVAIEHSHRLLASLVGFVTILLLLAAYRLPREAPGRRTLVRASSLALFLVIFQGVLGGVTVLLQLNPLVSTLHLGTSQIFLANLLYLHHQSTSHPETGAPVALRNGVRWAAAVLFLQMLLGASIRHGGAGIVCGVGADALAFCRNTPDYSGTLWPEGTAARFHMLHRFLGLALGFVIILGTLPLLRFAKAHMWGNVRALIIASHALWLLQVLAGLFTIYTGIGMIPVTAHLVLAVLLWFVILKLNFIFLNEGPTSSASAAAKARTAF